MFDSPVELCNNLFLLWYWVPSILFNYISVGLPSALEHSDVPAVTKNHLFVVVDSWEPNLWKWICKTVPHSNGPHLLTMFIPRLYHNQLSYGKFASLLICHISSLTTVYIDLDGLNLHTHRSQFGLFSLLNRFSQHSLPSGQQSKPVIFFSCCSTLFFPSVIRLKGTVEKLGNAVQTFDLQ